MLYPDVAEQEVEFKYVMPRKEVEGTLLAMCRSLGTGLLAYQSAGKQAIAFTSVKFHQFKERMVKGAAMVDLNGDRHEVVSDSPFMCGGEFCVRTLHDRKEVVCPCTFLIPLNEWAYRINTTISVRYCVRSAAPFSTRCNCSMLTRQTGAKLMPCVWTAG